MKIERISDFESFCTELSKIGFCLSGDNGEGVFSLEPYYAEDIEFHTGDDEKDPWQWRIRAVREKDSISYGKVFLNKSGWITKEWIPHFISMRRKSMSMDKLYSDGLIPAMDKAVYDHIVANVKSSLIDLQLRFGKENKSEIVKSLVNLQMKLLITTCDETTKISSKGEPYGWPLTVFCTIEEKFGEEVLEEAENLDPKVAYDDIVKQIRLLKADVDEKKMCKFIKRMP
ncbi:MULTISPECIES: hypothetical protein [unclassified Fusibacter]|uniref:AlkZ-related protein n=1 Tax=unclassified Fusibacter TaxID=2624464 RepID=UPI0010125E00|nr:MULTISPECIES: hypothetical protein [unclassified Fusibacter]MCK8058657.1 hypothetical protein [Fusibacter sp. A2]NPE21732.1 hypothetical protein [Fusibacter sp. A1]RXV61306.1 hypothetical protein DWB64_07795 [Fusibacter sp. A1]